MRKEFMQSFVRTILGGVAAGVLATPAASIAVAQPSAGAASAPASAVRVAPAPFAVGEELQYSASFAGVRAGSATMKVEGIENVRGRPAYHLVFTIDGGIPFYRVRDRYESWVDVQTLTSLRHVQNIREGSYRRHTTYEIFPDRAQFRKNNGPLEPSVSQPLDDGSFIYAIRAAMPRVGETRRDDRYFRPDRNPVVLTGVRNETVRVDAGRFATTVIHPSIKANGIFSDNGDAQLWLSDDANRYPVQLKSRFSRFSLTLELQSVKPGDREAQEAMIAEVLAAR
jgi:hypothetical protein